MRSRRVRSLALLVTLSRARLEAFSEAEEAGELLEGTPASVDLVRAEDALNEHDAAIGFSRLGGRDPVHRMNART